jgi:hypothetical protein
VLRDAISHGRLMRESTDRVETALRSGNLQEQLVAHRLMESAAAWMAWESEHSSLMREVAEHRLRRTQAAVLKKAAFRLIHRKALFEYLRTSALRGDARQRLVAAFHPTRSYAHAVVAEHGLYLRKACSLLCTSHLGGAVVRDSGFRDPMRRYESLYAEYFGMFCRSHFGLEGAADASQEALLPLLKTDVERCRRSIMGSGAGARV